MTQTRWRENPGARQKLYEALAQGVAAVARATKAVAEETAPRLTGRLGTSVDRVVALDGVIIDGTPDEARGVPLTGARIVGVVGADFPGRLQEEGTQHSIAQPFIGPAADAIVPRAPGIIAGEVKRRLPR